MINKERLADVFVCLCQISSPSRSEADIASFLQDLFKTDPKADEILEDASAKTTGSECGNLIVRFNGDISHEPVFFCCHLDTVNPGRDVKVKREGDIFKSFGDTVLGGDDKSGIAILIEVIRSLHEDGIPHGPVEFVFTTCEEIGLLGAKAFNHELLHARMGYALDTSGIDRVIIGAPAANRLVIEVGGLASHAGLNPDKGINAIQLAAEAISRLSLGYIDQESTANIGIISGGTATNIIPDYVKIEGEVRSHSASKLETFTRDIEHTFIEVINNYPVNGEHALRPSLEFSAVLEYPSLRLTPGQPVLQRLTKAAERLARPLEFVIAGGGSDANIFNSYGLKTAILGTGMSNVHSTTEFIRLQDMTRTAELVMSCLIS